MKITPLFLVLFALFILHGCGIIRTSLREQNAVTPEGKYPPIMDMDTYKTIMNVHPRPYFYRMDAPSGSVIVAGISHTRDPKNSQIDSIKDYFTRFGATVILAEGKGGLYFPLFQDAVKKYGETGLMIELGAQWNIPVLSWEPARETEIALMLQYFSAEQLAAFYSFRPYFSNFRFGKPDNPEVKLQEYLENRTNYQGIKSIFSSWKQLDSLWKKDFASEKDWRDYSDEYGWPKGYLSDIFNASNNTRDEHLCNLIYHFIKQGERVFVTVGVSHAPRIEARLRAMVQSIQ